MPIENYGSPSTHHDKHGMEKPQSHNAFKQDAEHPGYETTDVNTRGIVVFLSGLVAFVVVFFFLCFGMGKAINTGLLKQDNAEAALQPQPIHGGPVQKEKKREDLLSDAVLEQRESARIAQSIPAPRLEADDGNQSTSDLHAREDLLLEHTSIAQDGTLRIPIEQAMALIVKRGLPQAAAGTQESHMYGEEVHTLQAPLTDGFARTAYELEQREMRKQALELEHVPTASK